MPELPEVETTRRGLEPHAKNRTIRQVVVRDFRLRWPIDPDLSNQLAGLEIIRLNRRGKYILLDLGEGSLLVHLGMSGSLRVESPNQPPRKHDHVDLLLDSGTCLRFHDPRRFGCILWTQNPPEQHPLLASLGPEPLEEDFNGDYLYQKSRNREVPVKSFIMDSHVVVGVGNIYASESLHRAGISPGRAAGRISGNRYEILAESIREVLEASIRQGGTTLRDFVNGEGKPGYFRQTLQVYERAGETCNRCGTPIKTTRHANRATYWCPQCQT